MTWHIEVSVLYKNRRICCVDEQLFLLTLILGIIHLVAN